MTEQIYIGLDAWVIQDGNYGNFVTGRQYAFALEFWPAAPLVIRHPDAVDAPLSMVRLNGCTYAIKGRVSFATDGWWILETGLPMYIDQTPAPGPVGTPVRGEVSILIDHFSYFERLALQEGAPAMIYDWRVEAIERVTTPFIEAKPRHFVRDTTRQSWLTMRHTDAWKDDGGHGSYVLACKRMPGEPRHKR